MGLTRMVFVQLGNFTKKEEECKTAEDQWFYVLKHLNNMEYMPFSEVKERVFKKLGEYAKVSNLTGPEKQEYDRLRKFQLDYNSDMYYSRIEGEAKGRAEGEAIGKKEMARAMKEAGEPIEKICLYSGLSPEDINAL